MLRNHAPRTNHQLCGPDCRYRALYEGTQSSLSDMAAKQGSALGRHGRLRDGVITTLKSVLPRQFSDLEHRIASRLSDVDDEALIAYLSYLLEAAIVDGRISGASLVGTEELRGALRDTGVVVPDGDDLADWATAVRVAQRRVDGPAVGGSPLALPSPAADRAGTTAAAELRATPARRRSLADAARERDAGSSEPADGETTSGDGEGWAAWGDATGSNLPAESEQTGWAPRRTRTLSSVAAAKAAGAFDPPEVPEPSPYPSPLPNADNEWMDHGKGPGPVPAGDGHGGAETSTEVRRTATAGAPTSGDQDSKGPRPATGEATSRSNSRRGRGGAKRPASPRPGPAQGEPQEPTQPAPQAARRPQEQDAEGGPQSAGIGWQDAAKPAPKVVRGPALRPELFPTLPGAPTAKRPGRRQARTQATPPDSRTFDMAPSKVDDDTELSDELRVQLASAVAIPRPVFTSDLASMFGSEAVVEKWQNECRAAADSAVRFVAPKSRHRLRGSLVVPIAHLRSAAVEFKRSWWAECIEHHKKAGKLYELAVLLHAAGEQVVSYKVHEHKETVLLRLKQPRGVVGVVVVMEGRLGAGETTRNALVEDLEELMAGSLELLVVLAINDPAYTPLVAALEEEGAARAWQPPCHVVSARSWEYAAGNTSALRHVLG